MVNIGELMYKSFMNGMYQSFIIIGPYIIGPLIVAFIGLVIEKISEEILYLIFNYPHKHYTFKHFEV